MVDASGLVLRDEFALSFHMHFHKLLKWLVAGPLALMVLGLGAALRVLALERSDDLVVGLGLAVGAAGGGAAGHHHHHHHGGVGGVGGPPGLPTTNPTPHQA